MRSSLLFSTGLHAAVVAIGFFGLPLVQKPPPTLETPILVEFVEVGAKTNLPTQQQKPEKKKEPEKKEVKKEEPKPEPPEPKPAPPKAAPPPPAPAEEEVAALPPEPLPAVKPKPKPKPKVEAKPEPKPKPKPVPKAKPKPPTRIASAKPKRKPKPPDPFASVLKTLADIKPTAPQKKEPEKPAAKKKAKAPEPSFEEQIAKAISRENKPFDRSRKLSVTYYQKLRATIMGQLQPCWIIPAGAKGAGGLAVEIKMQLAPDGNVLRAGVVDQARMLTDGFYRAAAESALRAVSRESRCTPLKLPRDDFEVWRDLVINFDPREVIGR